MKNTQKRPFCFKIEQKWALFYRNRTLSTHRATRITATTARATSGTATVLPDQIDQSTDEGRQYDNQKDNAYQVHRNRLTI